MLLHSLTITNFRVIRSARVQLPDKVLGIIGPNGAGKSSLVEAVAWALYGNPVARSGKEEIPAVYAAGDGCEVALEFSLGPEHYRVIRRLVGRGQRPEVLLFRGDQHEAVGSNEANRRIQELLGLDWRGFLTSFLARQQELNALAEYPPAQRREHLAGMLGVQRLDKAIGRARSEAKTAGEKAVLLEKQTARQSELEGRLSTLAEHIQRLSRHREESEGALAAERRKIDELTSTYREHERLQAECSRIKALVAAAEANEKQLVAQQQMLRSEEARLQKAASELAEIEPKIAGLDVARIELAELSRRRQNAELAAKLEAQIQATKVDQQQSEQILKSRRDELAEITAALQRIPEDVVLKREKAAEVLEQARREFVEHDGDLKALRKERERVSTQLTSIADIGPEAVCDRCHRPFGDDLPKIREHLSDELAGLDREIERQNSELEQQRSRGRELRGQLEALEKQVSEREVLRAKSKAIHDQLEDLSKRQVSVSTRLQQLTEQRQELGEIVQDTARLAKLSTEVPVLEKMAHRAAEISGELKSFEPTRQRLAEIDRKVEESRKERAEYSTQLSTLGFDEAQFSKLRESLARQQQATESARDTLTQTAKELELTQREHQLVTEELGRLKETAAELDKLRTDQFYTERLARLFGDFKKYTIARIRPRLAELAGEIISEASGGRYSMVELDEDYNIQVMDYGRFYGVERFSGGEKDLASLCLRLAISLALTESAGLDRSFVILDEVFGSQDSSRRESIFEALAQLRYRFPQMILITHLEELRNKVESLIEVIPTTGGWSEVVVDGQTV